ncbi:hypothetical protein EXIGLDRAFT_695966 [Exidia glandulosa HHB12029]|uniref:Uncharacterized protein n=1 Tax=Exidia glandulosa HHB12029 TaxID=1314781 RepID=A0A165QGQ7_EXIGL|nr:hypothetical protein EXIGLDRAFT_695966 [Exidia glandulosa HHB12029]
MPTSSKILLNWIFPGRGCSLLLNRHETCKQGEILGTVCKDGVLAFKHSVASNCIHELFTRLKDHYTAVSVCTGGSLCTGIGFIPGEDIYVWGNILMCTVLVQDYESKDSRVADWVQFAHAHHLARRCVSFLASRCDRPMRHTYDVRLGRNERCVELEIDGKGRPSIQLAVNHRDCDNHESISTEDNGPCIAPGKVAFSRVVTSRLKPQSAQISFTHYVSQHGTMSAGVYDLREPNLVAANSAA